MTLPQAAMIDLHSHILPSVDDGAPDLTTALKMARMAVDDGIAVMACTPHMLPGVYDNNAADIRDRVSLFNQQLRESDGLIPWVLASQMKLIGQRDYYGDRSKDLKIPEPIHPMLYVIMCLHL